MPEPLCICAMCQNNHEFDLPVGLVDDIMAGNVAFFAGAGVSTESSKVLPFSLYDDVAHELDSVGQNLSFPALMSRYCQQRDGRLKLIHKIRGRFSYIHSFLPIYRNATRFHSEMATFFPIDTIITTNWDTYFEDECAATPFVSDEDMALWSAVDRKVLKIHGSIQSLGSIIATEDDYKRSKKNLERGLIGGRLKSIISDKTIIYVGYSFRDDDLAYINRFVSRQLGQLGKQAYIVTLDDSEESKVRYKSANLIPIYTDATYFVEQLKGHAINSHCLMPDSMYAAAMGLLRKVNKEQDWIWDKYKVSKNPCIMFSAFYQDGLIHALERVIHLRSSGTYSHRHYMFSKIDTYERMRKEKVAKRAYGDICYIDGYANALMYLSMADNPENEEPPLFYAYGMGDLWDRQQFKAALPDMPNAHKAASGFATKEAQRVTVGGSEMVIHHLAQL